MHLSGFEIGEALGGGERCIYRARRTSDDRRVLLRAANNGAGASAHARALLARELELCRELDVDGVLTTLDLVDGRSGSVLVLADAPGESLDRVLSRRGGPLPLAKALAIGGRLASILSVLHQRDLVHRDLRPANVIYDEVSGRVRLTGLGRASQVPQETWRIRAPERLEGDPAYLAPEATGRLNRQLDYRADLYSLGVVLFEMLTGRPPFDDTDPSALVYAHIALEPPDLSAVRAPADLSPVRSPTGRPAFPAAVSAIVAKLLAKAAEERYQSGLGLRHDLERCLAGLQASGEIPPFAPGERDVAERFELPQNLIGRQAELQWLEGGLAAAAAGRTAMRLVAGFSGVGKTSLVEEIRLSVLRRRGHFASGTFDRSARAAPYDGILTALQSLVLQRLGAKPEQVEAWAQRLEEELGANLGVMTEALPELLKAVDTPPTVPAVQPENARNRFHRCVEGFLATFDAPLVLFLDDLQWIDHASIELLESLLSGDGVAFLLLGAYRDNEVDEDHLLRRTVAELTSRSVDIDTLRLRPLDESTLSQLVAETLHLPAQEAAPLAELVYRKTAGNPFFARTFLNTLHQRRLLRFTATASQQARWTWDLEAITSLEATENVVELVARQLTELPPAARRTVAAASMLGKEIDVETLAVACETASSAVEGTLIEACREGLFVKVGERYTFIHDRVREGAYALLEEEERADFHLRLGRLLRDRAGEGRRGVFEIVDHLNQAALRLTDPAERRELVQLNAKAGRQARASGAFSTADTYLRSALEHLSAATANGQGASPWDEDYELARTLHGEAAEAASLAGDFEAAERLAVQLRDNARDLLDAVPAYETRIYMLYARRKEEEAIRLSLDVLGRLGVEIPMHPEAADLEAAVAAADRAADRVLATVEKDGIQALSTLRDPAQLTISRLLGRTGLMASWHRIRILRLTTCRLVELTAAHGIGPASPLAYVLMADVCCGELEDVAGGRRVGELGLALADHPDASGLEAPCRLIFELLIGGRTVHPAVLQKRFAEHFRRNLAAGDLLVAGAGGLQHSMAGLLAGHALPEVEASARAYHAKVQSFGQLMMAHGIERVAQLAAVLRGQGTVEEATDTTSIAPGAVASVRTRVIGPEMMVRFLLRQGQAALRAAQKSLTMPNGIVPIFPFDFYRCLIFLDRVVEDGDGEENHGIDETEFARCQARLEKQALAAPEIYQHKFDLVKAHQRRAIGATDEALARYEQAIAGARRNGFPHEEALAREHAAELCLELGHRRAAAAYLQEALAAYKRWGASAKVEQLFERYPDLAAAPDDSADSLDVTSLERAQNALASELDLAQLLRQLMKLLLQNAGAQRGFLLRKVDDRIVIDASGVGGDVHLPEALTLDAYGRIAAAVVHFVARTEETVTLSEARHDPRFASDPYIERVRPRSLLCFPLLHRGQVVEIIYLENESSPGVFSSERSTAVRLLASQAAAALQNARLYNSLEQEVETRREAEAELAALKDRLEAENVYLQEEIQSHFEEIVGASEAMRNVLYKVEQVAATDATVLILGETGTGKELIARALHRLSGRRERPLVKVNCAALPTTLIESELFGHEKGAFTGALNRKAGRFELADSGTLFLDEIGDLPLELQAKFLRVLQEGEFERLGGTKTMQIDVRIIAATNRDLEEAMAEGTFRSDLYYRLTVFPVELPPLRERRGDVPLLVHYFVDRKRAKLGKNVEKIPQDVMARLASYGWPGNVRELENVVERALILSPGDTLHLEASFGAGKTPAAAGPERLVDLERTHIRGVLEACDWKVKGQGNAADRLGLTPPTLRNRMKKLGIARPVA